MIHTNSSTDTKDRSDPREETIFQVVKASG
jgi:hypothetical protein